MARTKNHLSPAFVAKVRGILYEGQNDSVTPAEFVLYLLETHKEDGLFKPITRDQFSMKVKGREHYFSEVFSKEKEGDTLPRELAAALANLTGTEPFFWQATSYSLAQAKEITIDMSKDLNVVPENKVTSAKRVGPSKITEPPTR